MGVALPVAFLEAAAPGYLAGADWDGLGEDWLEQALAYAAAPCKGVRGPLTRIRPRPPGKAAEPGYRLADYLDQHGRRAHRGLLPPAGFWDAAARFASLGELPALAEAAEAHGLLREAARLRKHAAACGDTGAATHLIRQLHSLDPADHDPAQWAAAHAALDNPYAVARLLEALREAGADDQATALAARAAAHAALDNPYDVAELLRVLRGAGADGQAATLLARDPAAHAALDDPYAVARLLDALREAGADDQAAALAARAAAHTALDNPYDVARLLDALREAGADGQAAALLARDPAAHAALDNPAAVARLLDALRNADAEEQVSTLVDRLPAGGLFDLFCEQANHQVVYRFGREPDGTPAPSWGWDDC